MGEEKPSQKVDVEVGHIQEMGEIRKREGLLGHARIDVKSEQCEGRIEGVDFESVDL